jgi:hypothetical protein
MSAAEVRATLRELLDQAPLGGKRAVAEALGFVGRWRLHSLKSIARGRGYLFPSVRARLSRKIGQLERGELTLVATGARGPGKRLFRVEQAPPE